MPRVDSKQCEKPDAVIAAVGGGGLLCGVLECGGVGMSIDLLNQYLEKLQM